MTRTRAQLADELERAADAEMECDDCVPSVAELMREAAAALRASAPPSEEDVERAAEALKKAGINEDWDVRMAFVNVVIAALRSPENQHG